MHKDYTQIFYVTKTYKNDANASFLLKNQDKKLRNPYNIDLFY